MFVMKQLFLMVIMFSTKIVLLLQEKISEYGLLNKKETLIFSKRLHKQLKHKQENHLFPTFPYATYCYVYQ